MQKGRTATWQDLRLKFCPSSILPFCNLINVALVSIVAIVTMLATHTAADADLWGHLRFGADLLASGRLPVHDPYSFTSDIAWVNHEWLSELIFAAVYTHFGALGLNLLKLALIGGVAALLWRTARRVGATTFSAVVFTALVILATTTRTGPIRPQLFSVVCFAILIEIANRIEAGSRFAVLAVPALLCVWANMHGGWIVGAGAVSVWALMTRRYWLPALAALGTLINPYGVGLWWFVRDTVGLSRPEIVDWKPLLGLPPAIVAIEIVVPALAIAAVWRTRRTPPLSQLGVLAMLAVGTLRVSRIDAFLQVGVAMICAPAIVEFLNAADVRLHRSPGLTRASYANAVAAAALVAVAIGFSAMRLSRITVEGDWMPDGEAIHFIDTHVSQTRLVTWFDWGEYAIWHLSPRGIRVSMDGRRETVYSDRVLRDHFAFYRNASPDAWRYPDLVGADRVWLPKKLAIVEPLQAHGWHPIFESPTSVVLARDSSAGQLAEIITSEPLARAEFPGP